MKSFFAFLFAVVLTLFAMVSNTLAQDKVVLVQGQALTDAASAVELVTDQDYSWAKHVTGAYGTADYATQRVECHAWKLAVDQAQVNGKAGKYDEVINKSPLSRQKAWAYLNKLRSLMGGTKQANGSWTGYKTDNKGHYNGPEDLEILRVLAQMVKKNVASAQAAGMDKDMNGLDCAEAGKWADSYLAGILQ